MTVYADPDIADGDVTLSAPVSEEIQSALMQAELTEHQKGWFVRSKTDHLCIYFAVRAGGWLIGQTFLHDVDEGRREALVGYHLFRSADRGRGYGAAALRALCSYAFDDAGLVRLVAITHRSNFASRRIASKAGFRDIGTAREGKDLVVYESLANRRPGLPRARRSTFQRT